MYSLQTDLSLPYRSNAQPGKPLLVLLHGVGGNETNLLRLEPYFSDFNLVSVQAPLALGTDRYAWFNVEFTPAPVHNASEAEVSRQKLVNFLTELNQQECNAQKPFVLGFSQGAIMGLSLALSVPELLGGVVAMSGRVLQEQSAKATSSPVYKALPVLVTHGVHDAKLPISHGRNSEQVLEPLVDLDYREYDVSHELGEESLNDTSAWLSARTNVAVQ